MIFGDFNPCAKLPLTWPKDIRDTPAHLNFGSTKGRVLYSEDVYVGYKYLIKWNDSHCLLLGESQIVTTISGC